VFEDLRRAFREAVDNFNRELKRDQVGGSVDRLLKGMVDEVTQAKADLRRLEGELARTGAEVEREAAEVATCERREAMARDIGDDETARIAREYGEKHRRRHEVLVKKERALREEVGLRRSEIDEMLAQVKEAREQRASLSAQAGRTDARETLGETDDLFAELDRMAEKIGDDENRASAAADLGVDDPFDLRVDPRASPRRPDVDYDAALEELKRRMAERDGG
jgi:phage shock protein A